MEGSEYCFWHDPALVKERQQARSQGGKARHGRVILDAEGTLQEPVTLDSTRDVLDVVETALNDLLTLEKSVSRSRTLGYLASIALRVLEIGEIERRLEVLESLFQDNRHEFNA